MNNEIQNFIDSAFISMKYEYETIFKILYPANKASGFTEANQTINFVYSLKKELKDVNTLAWFEFPWEESSKRIDAIVYSPKYKTLFCIEAKRIWNTEKQESIKKDIERLEEGMKGKLSEDCFINRNLAPFDAPFNTKVNHIYFVALGDVWLEKTKTKSSFNKKAVPLWWLGDKYKNKVPQECSNELSLSTLFEDTKEENPWVCNLHEFKTLNSPTKYCLMIAYKQHF